MKTDIYNIEDIENLQIKLATAHQKIAELEEVLEDKRRLTREIDVILNGENGAQQASLCDVVEQICKLKNRLQGAEGLLSRATYWISRIFSLEPERGGTERARILFSEIQAFLTPTPVTEPDTCCGHLKLSSDKSHWTCDNCGKELPMAYTPKTEMGKKMLALREKAVAEGMTLLDEDEITGEDMVMVRREDLEFMQQNIDRVARCFRTVLSPDSPASQFLGIIEKMREKGFEFILSFCGPGYEAEFTSGDKEFYGRAATLTEAVSLAARAALTAPE